MTLQGPNGGNLPPSANSTGPNSGQQDPRLHSSSQEPGASSHPQHHVSARPVFYIHAPPPLPFLHYQWPMPFSYNPFTGFPGMGYGMVMPPFPPPPPYLEAPSYVLPHPHVQAVDYRRLLHPQVHAASAPYQNPNQTRRIRPNTVPARETVNSEVQTEPPNRGVGGYGGGSLTTNSDSGHGTASSSPSSSSSSQKGGSAEVENSALPGVNAEDFRVKRTSTGNTVKHGFNVPHPTGTQTVQSLIGAIRETQESSKDGIGQENVPPCRNLHCNVWSASSPDSIIPVCSSSQQEDETVKERRVSIPDILMSWAGGTPQETKLKMADEVLSQNDHQLQSSETELREKSVYQSPAETQNDPVMDEHVSSSKGSETPKQLLSESRGTDDAVDSMSHCLPYEQEPLYSLNKSHTFPDDEQTKGDETNLHEDTREIIPYQMPVNGYQTKRKMNESVWSVESLIPFIPTKEWLMQNGIFEPEVIIEMTEEAENCRHSTQNDNLIVKAGRRTCRYSSSDSVPMSDSWLIFSTPAEKTSAPKMPEMDNEINASEMRGTKEGQNMAPSEKDPLTSPTCLQSKLTASSPAAEGVDANGSSEPEAIQSPNQESLIVNEQQENSPDCPEQEATLLLSAATRERVLSTGHPSVQNRVDSGVDDGACGNKEVRNQQLCVPKTDQNMSQVSPSKGHLVDCGVQCTELKCCECEELKSITGPNRRHLFKYSDMKKTNSKTEGICMNGHVQKNQKRHNQWKSRGSDKHSSQQEVYNGFYGKPGKSKGGNGRNPRY